MLVVVGAGGGRAGVLLDAVQEPQVRVLRLRTNDKEDDKRGDQRL